MKYNYSFYIATPHRSVDDCDLAKSFDIIRDSNFHCKTNNTEGLPKCYNDYIRLGKWSDDDRIIFLHDDLELHDYFWKEKLDACDKDIIGLAGGKNHKRNPVAMWNIMTNQHSGIVFHKNNEDKIWVNSYGPCGETCSFIDGFFIVVKPKQLIDLDLWFDEDFTFNHYDSSFCVRAGLKKLTVGTPKDPIFVIHRGLGELTTEFQKSNEQFKLKYYQL